MNRIPSFSEARLGICPHFAQRLTSQVDASTGVQFIREFRLDAKSTHIAGRRTCDTRDEFCVSVSFMIAGVLLRRHAHTKTSCVGFRETQGQRVQIPSFHSVFPFSPQRKSFSSVAASLLNASAQVLLVC